MSKKILLLAIVFIIVQQLRAQEYVVQGVSPSLHLNHSVGAKETWYSLGRVYNLAPKDLAAYNKMNIAKPLEIGQQIAVPLTADNFSQNDQKAGGETFVPVYHVVQPKEWLYRVSVNYNKVPVENLQKWNGIGKDGAKPGAKLIIGYLKVKDANATLAPKSPQPAVEPKADVPAKQTPGSKKSEPAAEPEKTEPAGEVKAAEPEAKALSSGRTGSYFQNMFDDSGKSSSGVTGIFKSTSGWKDGKYYALMSNVPVGTIVRITYPTTNKVVYAKILGELPDMKESAGLALRISDAAAYELGSPESKFSVDLKY